MKKSIRFAVCLALLAGWSGAQDSKPNHPHLEAARLVQELEHDLPRALSLYQVVAANVLLAEPVRRKAWLNVGRIQQSLGNQAEARKALGEAAKGTDAVAQEAASALAQEPIDTQRALDLRKQAEAALVRLRKALKAGKMSWSEKNKIWLVQPGSEFDDLVWLGAAAVPLLAQEIEQSLAYDEVRRKRGGTQDEVSDLRMGPEPLPLAINSSVSVLSFARSYRAHLGGILWMIGDETSLKVLKSFTSSSDPNRCDVAALGLAQCRRIAEDAVPLWEAFMGDKGVPTSSKGLAIDISQGGSPGQSSLFLMLPPDRVVKLIDLNEPALAAKYLRGMSQVFDWRDPYPEIGLAPVLREGLNSSHPGLNQSCVDSLMILGGLNSPMRQLTLEWLGSLPADFRVKVRSRKSWIGNYSAAEEQLALAALRKLGPYEEIQSRGLTTPRLLLAKITKELLRSWGPEAIELALEAARLNYVPSNSLEEWFAGNASLAMVPSILEVAADQPEFYGILTALPDGSLGNDSLGPLKRLYEWAHALDYSRDPLLTVLSILGRIESDEAVQILLEAAKGPGQTHAGAVLAKLSERYDSPKLRTGLGELLEWKYPAGVDARHTRTMILVRLLVLGDEPSLERIAHWGHYKFGKFDRYIKDVVNQGQAFGSASLLAAFVYQQDLGEKTRSLGQSQTIERVCKVSAESMGRIWKEVFSNPVLIKSLQPSKVGEFILRHQREPDDVYFAIATRYADYWTRELQAGRDKIESDDRGTLRRLARLLTYLDHDPVEMPTPIYTDMLASLAAFADAALQGKLVLAAKEVIAYEGGCTRPGWKEKVLPWSHIGNIAGSLVEGGAQLNRQEFESSMSAGSVEYRIGVLDRLDQLSPGANADWVHPFINDKDADVRTAACKRLGLMLDKQGVPWLLESLKDSVDTVRASAQESLRQIRFYHDEQARWKRFFDGTGLDSQSAAEALLKQAKPDQSIQLRVTAIRSLGKLGQPEVLPFLIEWSQDTNAEIATAAGNAIEAILKAE